MLRPILPTFTAPHGFHSLHSAHLEVSNSTVLTQSQHCCYYSKDVPYDPE